MHDCAVRFLPDLKKKYTLENNMLGVMT